jgi:hypothetical protein
MFSGGRSQRGSCRQSVKYPYTYPAKATALMMMAHQINRKIDMMPSTQDEFKSTRMIAHQADLVKTRNAMSSAGLPCLPQRSALHEDPFR